MESQHLVLWCEPCSTQRQTQELISGPNLATRARLLSFNRTQSRVVIGLLSGHNTLRRHLYIMGLSYNPTVGNVVLRRKPESTFCVHCRGAGSSRHPAIFTAVFGELIHANVARPPRGIPC